MINNSSIEDPANKIFSKILVESSALTFTPPENISGKFDESVKSYGQGALVSLKNDFAFLDFRLKARENNWGYNHPILIRSKLKSLHFAKSAASITPSQLDQIQSELYQILRPLGKWSARIARDQKILEHEDSTLLDCQDIDIDIDKKIHQNLNGPNSNKKLILTNFNLFSHYLLLDEKINYIFCNDFLPLPIEITPYNHFDNKTVITQDYTYYDLICTMDCLSFLKSIRALEPNHKVFQSQKIINSLESAFNNIDGITLSIYGHQFSLAFEEPLQSKKLQKYLWKKGILSTAKLNTLQFSCPYSCKQEHLLYLRETLLEQYKRVI